MTSTLRATLGILVIAAATELGAGAPVHAYCPFGGGWVGSSTVSVFHAPNLYANLRHLDGTVWTEGEVNAEIGWVLSAMNSYSNANLPTLINAGPSPACSGDFCRMSGAINIIPNEDVSCTAWCTEDGMLVRLERFSVCGTSYYDHYPPRGHGAWNTGQTLTGVLMHEIGHALGLDHPYGACDGLTCTSFPCAVMQMGTSGPWAEAQTYYVDDAMGFVARHGGESYPNQVLRESTDATSWYNLSTGGMPPFQPMSSLSSSNATRMFATYRDVAMNPHAAMWDFGPIVWSDWFASATDYTQGLTGAGLNADTGYAYSFWLRGETQLDVYKSLGMRQHTSATTGTTYTWSSQLTRRHGVSGTHDPKSLTRIQAWRNSFGEIRIQVVDGGTFINPFVVLDGSARQERAYDTPVIACGAAAITNNCIIAWAYPAGSYDASHYHYLRWMHFRVTKIGGAWALTQGPIMTQGYILNGSPAISYRAGASAPYVLSWTSTPQFTTWTIAKSTADNVLWDSATLRSHTQYTHRVAPAIGSASTYSELVTVRR